MENIVMDLQAVIVYLRVIDAVYPVAPQKAIATVERAIEYINAQASGPAAGVEVHRD